MAALSHSFQVLTAAWHQDAAGDHVEILAADFAAKLAAAGQSCGGLARVDAVRRFYGLACFLATFGVTLRWRYRSGKDAVFLFAEIQLKQSCEHVGATVRETMAVYRHAFKVA